MGLCCFQAFRDKLLPTYGKRCAFTGCDVVNVFEAARIIPYLGQDTNHVTNGLLLRADLQATKSSSLWAAASAAMASSAVVGLIMS